MDCIISGTSVHGKGWECKEKVAGDQSWCYVSNPVTKQQHGVGGEKIHNPNIAVSKFSCGDGSYHLSKPFISK